MLANFERQTGWLKTRASGILAILVSAYPDMTWPEIYAWCHANSTNSETDGEPGLDNWPPSISPDDYTAFVGLDGSIYFSTDYPLPDDWSARFTAYKNGTLGAELPPIPQPDSPAAAVIEAATAAVEPVQVVTTVQPNSDQVIEAAVQESAAAVPAAMPIYPPEQIAPSAVQDAAAAVPAAMPVFEPEPMPQQAMPAIVTQSQIPAIAEAAQAATQQTGTAQNGLVAVALLYALL